MSNAKWKDDSLQFPRLIAELNAAGAFTQEVNEALADSMGLTKEQVDELVERAVVKWDAIKAAS